MLRAAAAAVAGRRRRGVVVGLRVVGVGKDNNTQPQPQLQPQLHRHPKRTWPLLSRCSSGSGSGSGDSGSRTIDAIHEDRGPVPHVNVRRRGDDDGSSSSGSNNNNARAVTTMTMTMTMADSLIFPSRAANSSSAALATSSRLILSQTSHHHLGSLLLLPTTRRSPGRQNNVGRSFSMTAGNGSGLILPNDSSNHKMAVTKFVSDRIIVLPSLASSRQLPLSETPSSSSRGTSHAGRDAGHHEFHRSFSTSGEAARTTAGKASTTTTTHISDFDKGTKIKQSASSTATTTATKDSSTATSVAKDSTDKLKREKINYGGKGMSSSSSSAMRRERSIVDKATSVANKALKSLIHMIAKTPGVLWYYLTHPRAFRLRLIELRDALAREARHYWMGSKLLAADVRTARHIMGRTLRGSTLSRRERKQLLRTVTDVFRLVPMSVFVLIPFMEFALPFALKMFPNMLPSTFQDSLKEEEKMKGELQTRISMAGFFQDTLAELAKEQRKFAQIRKQDANDLSSPVADADEPAVSEEEASATSFLEFLKKARTGEAIPPNVIIKFAKYFEDNLALDNMGRMQLVNMCKYMGIPPYGNDNLLRFQLRHRIRLLKDDDQRILWDGIESLTKMELREACRERGMRSTGLSKDAYRKALQQWLDLSVRKEVPVSLLIMSRTFFLHDEMVGGGEPEADDVSSDVTGLADAMSGIDKEVVNEIVFEMASSEEKSKNADIMKIQLEVLEHQNEKIKEEQEEREAAAKEQEEKEAAAKEKEEREREAAAKEKDQEEKKDKGELIGDGETLSTTEEEVLTEAKAAPFAADVLSFSTDSAVLAEKPSAADEEEEEQAELSTEEIDAISQLVSPDPVLREREELKRIKEKMQVESATTDVETFQEQSADEADEEARRQAADASLEYSAAISPGEPIFTETAQDEAARSFTELEEEIEKEAKEVTVISMHGDTATKFVVESNEDDDVGDSKLQKAIDRLKSRVDAMVGKIETQLSDVEVKIGDKFYLLDLDGDGVVTREEMAQVLQTVLKRKLTEEEAMAIAMDMDHNKDGVVSIAELAQWAETNTIVKLAEDGREKDVEDMITARVANLKEKKEQKKKM